MSGREVVAGCTVVLGYHEGAARAPEGWRAWRSGGGGAALGAGTRKRVVVQLAKETPVESRVGFGLDLIGDSPVQLGEAVVGHRGQPVVLGVIVVAVGEPETEGAGADGAGVA